MSQDSKPKLTLKEILQAQTTEKGKNGPQKSHQHQTNGKPGSPTFLKANKEATHQARQTMNRLSGKK